MNRPVDTPLIAEVLAGLLLLLLLAGCQPIQPLSEDAAVEAIPSATAAAPAIVLEPDGFIQRVHDPVMARQGDTYYIFHTGKRIPFICSPDMITWEFCGRVFTRNPAWTREVNPDLPDIWAPDISFFNDRWHLYYAVSTFGTQESAIGLATNRTLDPNRPEYEWVDQGEVLRSRPGDAWNAIDANLVLDESDQPWLTWGSFWDGIWLAQIDPTTGMLAEDAAAFRPLANRAAGPDGNPAIEAPFIIRHGDFWYLFVSFDQCCQGVASTYTVHVGRSEALTGPYVDREGTPLSEGGGTLILSEYGQWKGPGHNAVFTEDGIDWMVYHAYDARQIGVPKLRMESIIWDDEEWPSLPSQIR